MNISTAIQDYLMEIEIRQYTPKTIRGYRINLGLFLRFCEENLGITEMAEITPATVRKFTKYMTDRGRKGTYINGLLKAIKSFVQYSYENDYGGFDTKKTFKWCKEEKPIIVAFRPNHVKAMLKDCAGNEFLEVRDKTVYSSKIYRYIFGDIWEVRF